MINVSENQLNIHKKSQKIVDFMESTPESPLSHQKLKFMTLLDYSMLIPKAVLIIESHLILRILFGPIQF